MTVFHAVLLGLLLAVGAVHAQSDMDTYGNYFRMVFIDNFVDYPIYRPVDIYVCNKESLSNMVNITIPYFDHSNCPKQSERRIPPRSCFRFELCQEIRHTYADGSLAKKVVEVSAARDVSVQGFNVEKFSADSYAILPWELCGYQHYVMAYTRQSIQTQFAIVSKESTIIRIKIPDRDHETITIDYNGLRYSNGETVTFRLEPDTTFLAQSAGDLTGVMIQSSRKVAVFTGNVRTYNDYNMTSRDHLVEQVLPARQMGEDFIYVPTPRQRKGDTIKIIAKQDQTDLELIDENGVRRMTIGIAPTVLKLDMVTHLRSNGPILVAVFVRSQDGKEVKFTDPADPSMYFLPSIDQYDNEYYLPRFKDANETDYQKVWILVAIPEDYIRDVLVDNEPFGDISFLTRINRNRALPYRAGAYQVSSDSMHRIRLVRDNFMVIAYGASDRESFASSLGYQFKSGGCMESDMLDIPDGNDNDCDGFTDEETCNNGIDDDGDGLMDEDCGDALATSGSGEASGTSFAIVFMTNVVRDITNVQIDQIELYIAPLERDTVISVTAPAYRGPGKPNLQRLKGSVNSVMQIPINPNMRVTPADSKQIGRSTKTTKVIKVTSNKNIIVYGINKKQYSTDGFLALPESVLGSEYYAFCNSPISISDDRCQFVAAAILDNTEIYIDVPRGVTLDGIDGGAPIRGPRTQYVRLANCEAIEIQSMDDLTGTRVYTRDDKHFAFFSGNIRTKLPISRRSRDHLVEQLPSTDTWGVSFATMPTPRERDEGDVIKVIAKDRNTRIDFWYYAGGRFSERQDFVLDEGGHRDILINSSSPIRIQSTKPILVVQISKSAPPGSLFNDPSAMLVIPEDRWSNNYIFVNPLSGQRDERNFQLPFDNYLLLAIRREYRHGLIFQGFDGNEINLGMNADWVEMPGDNDIEGLVFQLPEGIGQSSIINIDPDATWMALTFGKANRETYGNPIGLRFDPHDDNGCSTKPMQPGDGIDNDCDGRIDEEMSNNIDDDGDGRIDEDLGLPPTGYRYIFVFEDNTVEYPRHYALEIYVGRSTNTKIACRMETPAMDSAPSYDITTVVHDPTTGALADRIQFAVSAILRAQGTSLQYNSIVMTCNAPVTVMGINKETFSSDAFVAFEERTLGTEYYTISYGKPTLQTQFAVVAVQDGTTNVEMRMRAPIVWETNDVRFLNVRLTKYQVFQAQSVGDLTGSQIRADQKVAVFSGNIRTKVKLSESRDHLVSQLPPSDSWGRRFNLVPTHFRSVGDLFRVVARESRTRLTWNGGNEMLNNAGDFVELDLRNNEPALLNADKPVMVMQIVKSQTEAYHSETADPCFILVPPISQYTNISTVITPLYSQGFYKNGDHYKNHLTIIVLDNAEQGIRIDGETVESHPDVRYANSNQMRIISGSNYIALDLILEKEGLGTYTITHGNRNVVFAGYLIGVADRESYCVSIGPNQTR